jgi:hypothetical protein
VRPWCCNKVNEPGIWLVIAPYFKHLQREIFLSNFGTAVCEWAAAGFKDTLLRWSMKQEIANVNEKAIQPGLRLKL